MRQSMNRLLLLSGLCLLVPMTAPDAQVPPADVKVSTAQSQDAMTPAAALDRLKEGNARFVSNDTRRRDWPAMVLATSAGQHPYAAVLACMDSRAPIEIIFDQALGDVFGIRVAGNVVNEDELGSLEYAAHAGTKLFVVLGHTSCGAVKGALDDVKLGHLTGLLAKIRPAVSAAGCSSSKDGACVTKVAEKNVQLAMNEIRARSPYLKKLLDQGTIGLVGGIYDVATGKVTFRDN